MASNHLLTGPPRSGKTTSIERTVDQYPGTVGGIVSPERRVDGERVGFVIEALDTGDSATMASVDRETGPAVGKYRVDVDATESVAVPALARALAEADLIVIDEIGPMQLHSDALRTTVTDALDAATPVLAAIAGGERGALGEIKARPDVSVHEVRPATRERLPVQLLEALQ